MKEEEKQEKVRRGSEGGKKLRDEGGREGRREGGGKNKSVMEDDE